MKYYLYLLICCLAILPACTPKTPDARSSSKAEARAVLSAAVTIVNYAFDACSDFGENTPDPDEAVEVGKKCRAYLRPAADGVRLAAKLVDGWTEASQEKDVIAQVACSAKAVIQASQGVIALLHSFEAKFPPSFVSDALEWLSWASRMAAPTCNPSNPAGTL